MSDPLKRFTTRLTEWMERTHTSQTELAEKSGVPRGQLNRYLAGKIAPGVDSLEKIARAMRVDLADLLREGDTPAAPDPSPRRLLELATAALADWANRAEAEGELRPLPADVRALAERLTALDENHRAALLEGFHLAVDAAEDEIRAFESPPVRKKKGDPA